MADANWHDNNVCMECYLLIMQTFIQKRKSSIYMYICMYVYIHIYASWSNGVQVHMNGSLYIYLLTYDRSLYTYSLTYESIVIHIFTPENSIVIHIFTHGD